MKPVRADELLSRESTAQLSSQFQSLGEATSRRTPR